MCEGVSQFQTFQILSTVEIEHIFVSDLLTKFKLN